MSISGYYIPQRDDHSESQPQNGIFDPATESGLPSGQDAGATLLQQLKGGGEKPGGCLDAGFTLW